MPDTYERLIVLLDGRRVPYQVLVHVAEGRSDRIAAIRGNRPEQGAEELTGCVLGAIPPFSFSETLPLIVDPTLLENEES